jgi:acetolactate decarboxylase
MHTCLSPRGDWTAYAGGQHVEWHRLCRPAMGAAAVVLAAFAAGCSPTGGPAPAVTGGQASEVVVHDSLVQFSLISALADGDYSEGAPLREVLAGGDFGIGTFDRLDGEMIVLEGQMYQALSDGTVRPAQLAGTTPFAAVTFFTEDGRLENLAAATLEDLDRQLDRRLPRRNSPYALRVDG